MSMLAEQLEPRAADATRQLFESHRGRIFAFCVSQLGNHHDAEDAVQTTFLYAFGCLERGVVPEAELAWLFKIALNVCRTRRRSLGRRRRIESPTDLDSCEYAMAAPESADDDLRGLSGALAAMPPNQRNALLLREWQGLSYAEIGERLTISKSAVETLLFRARRTLASQLREFPQKVAVMANIPLLLRLLRRLGTPATAIKTTAAVVACGAVASVGGQELTPGPAHRTAQPARASHVVESRGPSGVRVERPVATAAAVARRGSGVYQVGAPSVFEPAAVPPHVETRPAPTPTSTPDVPQPSDPAGPVAAPAPDASPAATPPTPPAESPAALDAGDLSGGAAATATTVVQAAATTVQQVAATATTVVQAVTAPLETLVPAVDSTTATTVTTVTTTVAKVLPVTVPIAHPLLPTP
jgi:RNA polymerase sigma factor (sigma-70 family)